MWIFSEEPVLGIKARSVDWLSGDELRKSVVAYTPSLYELDEMLECEAATWDNPEQRATPQMLVHRLRHHPEGFLAIRNCGRLEGMICFVGYSFPWESERYPDHYEIGAFGTMQTHEPLAETWCAINSGVRPDGEERSSLLLGHATLAAAICQGIRYIHGPARIPRYSQYQNTHTPEEYVQLRNEEGRLLDEAPNLVEFLGFKHVRVQPNFYNDPDSCNYASVWRWENPFLSHIIHGDVLHFKLPSDEMRTELGRLGVTQLKLIKHFHRALHNDQHQRTRVVVEFTGEELDQHFYSTLARTISVYAHVTSCHFIGLSKALREYFQSVISPRLELSFA